MKVTYQLTIDTTSGEFEITNMETGESKSVETPKRTRKKKTEESSTPQVILAENKYTLNTAACELLGVQEDARILIKYKKMGKNQVPVIGEESAFGVSGGNRLTKSHTVACRGRAHDMLAEYGTVFELKENSQDPGTYFLIGDKNPVELPETEEVEVEEDEVLKDLENIGTGLDDMEEMDITDLDEALNTLNV